jgi:hypothetical protein
MGAVLSFPSQLESIVCGQCGMEFAAPSNWLSKRKDGEGGNRTFFCPSGHERCFGGETEAQRLATQLAQRERDLLAANEREASLRRRSQTLEHRLHGTQGALAKVKKRIGNGVCPCCQRTFTKLGQHMKTQHPGFVEAPKP